MGANSEMFENGILDRAKRRLEIATERRKQSISHYETVEKMLSAARSELFDASKIQEECELECTILEQAMSPKAQPAFTCNGVLQSQEFVDRLAQKMSHELKSVKEIREEHKL